MSDGALDRFALMKSTTDRVSALFNSEDFSDVVFLVGSDGSFWRYPAHKFILSLASPVFRTMLASSLKEGQAGAQVQVTDVQPAAFENVMRYIYANDLRLDSVRGTLDTLYAAQKYMLYHLSSACLDFLEGHIDRENVLEIYQEVKLYDIDLDKGQVLHKCLQILDREANQILRSQAFSSLDLDTVKMILSREFLQVPCELDVFNALLSWAVQECRRKKMELTAVNKRRVLSKALYLVQYLSMSREEFLEGPAASGVLNDEECRALLSRIYGDEKVPLPSCLRRRPLKWKRSLYYCYPVKFFRKEPNTHASHVQEETIITATNHDIMLMGFDLYGPKVTEETTYSAGLHMVVSDLMGNVIGQIQWKVGHSVNLKDRKLYVEFVKAVFLKAKRKYKVQLFLPKGEYLLGENWEGTTTSKYKCRSIDFAIKYCRKNGIGSELDDLSDDESFAELDSASDDETVGTTNMTPSGNSTFPAANEDVQEVFIHSLFYGVKFYF